MLKKKNNPNFGRNENGKQIYFYIYGIESTCLLSPYYKIYNLWKLYYPLFDGYYKKNLEKNNDLNSNFLKNMWLKSRKILNLCVKYCFKETCN